MTNVGITPTTPNGRKLGARRDRPDPRDRLFHLAHPGLATTPLLPKSDYRDDFPACWDQGDLGSCGPHSGSALMCYYYPQVPKFDILQIYHNVMTMEGTLDQDDPGVMTRDVINSLHQYGAAPDADWPYDPKNYKNPIPQQCITDGLNYRLGSPARLVSVTDYVSSLSAGHPFILGFMVYDSLDSDEVAKTGVMPFPSREEIAKGPLGGHDVTVVGHDMDFYNNPDFKKSGLTEKQCGSQAILIRNSWGPDWGLKGYFWMPLSYAVNPSLGGDAWMGTLPVATS